ncbi:MAG: hypothetical protein LBJ65_14470 [Burkholderia sp.]|jgi:hypothetical protein|uniref:hypothetical protein n=1 Tax=Burkholderia sp. TaxID=36773 RepID=UPI00282FAB1D|nr:hypothetical protein [Burkholderia sp.]MDR0242802.1 hypothetical protein [Burkholderia sp.]
MSVRLGDAGWDGPEVVGGTVDGISPALLLAVATPFTSSPPHAASDAQVSAATSKNRGFFIF